VCQGARSQDCFEDGRYATLEANQGLRHAGAAHLQEASARHSRNANRLRSGSSWEPGWFKYVQPSPQSEVMTRIKTIIILKDGHQYN